MARIRTIKPEFWADEDLSELPVETHMLAAALLNHADDEGYFNANPKLVKAQCCPLRDDSVSVQESLRMLSEIGYLQMGKGADGKRYGCIRNFTKHQKINRPSASKIAAQTITWESSMNPHGDESEDSPPEGNRDQGSGNKDQGTGEPDADASDGGEAPPDPVRTVFDYWVWIMGKNPGKTKLTDDRRRKIQARLKDYSIEDCCRAIDGCAGSDFHMARSPDNREKRHDGIELIFRNGEKLEGFRDMAEGSPPGGSHSGFEGREYSEHIPDWAKE